MDIKVTGAEEFAVLARRLKQAGDKGLQRESSKGINRLVRPVKLDLRRSALDVLPERGGLAARVATSRFRVRRRASGRDVGIFLDVINEYPIRLFDKGIVWHPVYGRGRKVMQRITPGWFTRPTEAALPRVRAELLEAIRRVVRQIETGV